MADAASIEKQLKDLDAKVELHYQQQMWGREVYTDTAGSRNDWPSQFKIAGQQSGIIGALITLSKQILAALAKPAPPN